MKPGLLFLALALFPFLSFSQEITRLKSEPALQFANRLKPEHAEIAHQVIETKWNATPVILAFYSQVHKLPLSSDPDQQEYQRIIAKLFLQTDSIRYTSILIDTVSTEGGDPEIQSVFFANTDQDPAKELILIASWPQVHYDLNGTLYGTFVYDNLLPTTGKKLIFKKEISQKLSGGFEGNREGETIVSKFKTAKEIRAELKRLGYN